MKKPAWKVEQSDIDSGTYNIGKLQEAFLSGIDIEKENQLCGLDAVIFAELRRGILPPVSINGKEYYFLGRRVIECISRF